MDVAPGDGKNIQKSWKDFLNIAFPWAETAKKREIGEWAKRLAQEVARGPLQVTAQKDALFRSRLKAKVIDRERLSPEAAAIISKVSKKIPSIIPLKP
jgi:hypothetical protein